MVNIFMFISSVFLFYAKIDVIDVGTKVLLLNK
jgi:hypothetical protein